MKKPTKLKRRGGFALQALGEKGKKENDLDKKTRGVQTSKKGKKVPSGASTLNEKNWGKGRILQTASRGRGGRTKKKNYEGKALNQSTEGNKAKKKSKGRKGLNCPRKNNHRSRLKKSKRKRSE